MFTLPGRRVKLFYFFDSFSEPLVAVPPAA